MFGIRHLPLKYRLPLIHGVLAWLARRRSKTWPKAQDSQPQPGDFVVSGFLEESLGIGQAGRLSAEAFAAAGFAPIRHNLRPAFRQLWRGKAALPGSGGVWFIHANAPEVLVALLAHAPAQWAHRYRIGYWAWETPLAPPDWVWLADYLHEIWVPSQFVREALAAAFDKAGRSDLSARLRIMAHPVAPPPSPPVTYEYVHGRFGMEPELCEVVCLFDTKSSAARKHPWGVLAAWKSAFPASSDRARLTLKVSDLDSDPVTSRRLVRVLEGRTDMRLMSERLNAYDMQAFIGAFDILISLHRAEGFGLPLAEAMMAEVAVIATGWSGNLEFMNAENSRLVPIRLIPLRDPDGPYCRQSGQPGQVWADPDLDAAADALIELTGSDRQRNDLARAGARSLRNLSKGWSAQALACLPFTAWLEAPKP
ncbi:glycosyltransferase [Asticcacaulis sp. EMRT-3]|uniref:glycosyltransferase n=1 Tax=Asticcacaulis sp. EMRT-3 TaxID=3040349 RepID=UPI0024AECB2C|nr:glycosyltransferase [Asticcacaulis sp. EMRT-3]MDI7775686.1 glycosyltransferase [Asticcacaulis sp. EMRT-3]